MPPQDTWTVIFGNSSIRQQEFGPAYCGIPIPDRQQFVADFNRHFEMKSIGTNSHFSMILAEKV